MKRDGRPTRIARTAAGAEIDAVVERGRQRIGIEVKFSSAPKPTKGFWQALEIWE